MIFFSNLYGVDHATGQKVQAEYSLVDYALWHISIDEQYMRYNSARAIKPMFWYTVMLKLIAYASIRVAVEKR